MTQPTEIPVPADSSSFLAVAAGNYYDADLALFKIKHEIGSRPLAPAGQAHLDQLRQRRKETYADLVIWVMTVEAERLAVDA